MPKTLNQSSKRVPSTGRAPRIALIGCGAIAEAYYLPALTKWPRVLEALTLVDQDLERAHKLSAAFNVKNCLTDYRDALKDTDGAIIALPTHLHYVVAMEFLSRGIHVLCEKPLSESSVEAREMVELAHKMGVGLATNYSQRLWSQFAKVKELMRNRSLGEPVSIKYYVGEVFNWPTVSGFYFNSAGSRRGILLDRGAHVLDHICWWLGGKPQVISCQNDSFGGSEAVANVYFSYDKCVGEVKLSWLSSFPCKFVVEFEKGSIEGEIYYPESVLIKSGVEPVTRVNLKSETYARLGQKIVANFISVLAGGETPLVPASDVLDSIDFTNDCYAVATRFEMPWYEIPELNND